MKSFFQVIGSFCLLAFLAWWLVASITFSFRHPWATKTENFLHTGDALMFRSVPYNEMRPRE